MRAWILLAGALAALTPASALAADGVKPLEIVVRGDRVIAGGYDTSKTLGAAIRAYGPPSTRRRVAREACDVRWSGIGARFYFYNLGGLDACTPQGGYVSWAILGGDRWRTEGGLALGDPSSRIPATEPQAIRCDPRYLTAPARTSGRAGLTPVERRRVALRCARNSGGASGRWWLDTVYSPVGNTYFPRVAARVTRDTVRSFELAIAAGGD